MRKLSTREMVSASYADSRLPQEDAFHHGACFHVECLNNLGDGWMQTLNPNPLPFYLWIMTHSNGIVEYVMINGQLHLDWPSHWYLSDPTMLVLDNSEWPGVHDPEWEAAEAEYENGHVIDSVSEGEGESYECLTVMESKNKLTKTASKSRATCQAPRSRTSERVTRPPRQPRELKTTNT